MKKYALVVGRIPDDDECTLHTFEIDVEDDTGLKQDLIELFTQQIYDESSERDSSRLEAKFGVKVFIDHVMISDSPITDVP